MPDRAAGGRGAGPPGNARLRRAGAPRSVATHSEARKTASVTAGSLPPLVALLCLRHPGVFESRAGFMRLGCRDGALYATRPSGEWATQRPYAWSVSLSEQLLTCLPCCLTRRWVSCQSWSHRKGSSVVGDWRAEENISLSTPHAASRNLPPVGTEPATELRYGLPLATAAHGHRPN